MISFDSFFYISLDSIFEFIKMLQKIAFVAFVRTGKGKVES